MKFRKYTIPALLLCACTTAQAHSMPKEVTYDAIASGAFNARTVSGLRTMKDGVHYTTLDGGVVIRYRFQDGSAVDTLFDGQKWSLTVNGYTMSEDESKILIQTGREQIYRHSSRSDYKIYDLTTARLTDLSGAGKQQEATLSPDGTKAAFVRDNDLFWVDLSSGQEHRVTHDGEPGHVINGIPDWVYEEEYSFSRAYEWAPDSRSIAYYRFDESRVKQYNMNMFEDRLYPVNESFKYPKAGEENALVDIYVFHLEDGRKVKVDLGRETDIYIPRIRWAENELAVHHLNRLQNRHRMLLADLSTGQTRTVYEESDGRYVDRIDDQTVTFLPGGKGFIAKSERDGWKHLYLYDMNGRLLNRITQGEWEVTSLCGIDMEKNRLYYLSTEESPLRRDLYVVGLNGKGKKKLSEGAGTHQAVFSNGCRYYIDYFSSAEAPTRVTLHRADGKMVRVLEDNAPLRERLSEYEMPRREFFKVPLSHGISLNGFILKPVDFDPSKQYPVLVTQYSGPGSQRVADKWGWSWEAALVREGVLVVCVDTRGTGFRGAEFRKCTYGRLGELETTDHIETARYLASLPYVDGERIGIYGWSYGGFMALNCILKGADVFSLAVSVAPVTSWRYYDTIYTELYNGLPQENPKGYDQNSPIHFAPLLEGKLLLSHGTGDDNVHIQNSYEMIERLVQAGKTFDMLIYPDKNHGMGASKDHLMRRAMEFIRSGFGL